MAVWGNGQPAIPQPSFFDIFKPRAPEQVGLRRAIGGDQTGVPIMPNEPTITPIQQLYQRQPLFFSNYVQPYVAPTVDTSLYFPLDFKLHVENITIIEGSRDTILAPERNKHWLITHMFTVIPQGILDVAALFNPDIRLSMRYRGGDQISEVMLFFMGVFYTRFIPLIGTRAERFMDSTGTDPLPFPGLKSEGLRSIYINPGMELHVGYNNMPPDIVETAQLHFMYLELPENQPFSSLLGTL